MGDEALTEFVCFRISPTTKRLLWHAAHTVNHQPIASFLTDVVSDAVAECGAIQVSAPILYHTIPRACDPDATGSIGTSYRPPLTRRSDA